MDSQQNIWIALIGPLWNIFCALFKTVCNKFRPVRVNITDIECVLDKPPVPDGEGGHCHGSHAQFRLEIINKKHAKIVLSNIHCKALFRRKILRDDIRCFKKNAGTAVAVKPMTSLSLDAQACFSDFIKLSLGGDLSQCDKLVFYYKPGIIYKKHVVWKK